MKYCVQTLQKFKSQDGFSLLELLIYMAIIAGFLLVIVNIFFIISSSSAKEEAGSEVRQNLRFAIQQITDEVRMARSAAGLTLPDGDPGNILNIFYDGDTTEFKIVGGILQKTRGVSVENITTDKVIVNSSPFIFSRLGNTIQIKLKIDYNDNGRGSYKFSESIQTTASLRI